MCRPRGGVCSTIRAGDHAPLPRPRKTPPEPAAKAARSPKKKIAAKRAPRSRTAPPAAETPAAPEVSSAWLTAVRAAESKQAKDIRVLDLREVTTFADTLVICGAANARQSQTIADEIERELKKEGEQPTSVEGYTNAEWILLDYGDFVVNVFSEKARAYYDLERLWRDAKPVKY